jgi:hypothetical protein
MITSFGSRRWIDGRMDGDHGAICGHGGWDLRMSSTESRVVDMLMLATEIVQAVLLPAS